jgi:CBS domain-containing membrane protein
MDITESRTQDAGRRTATQLRAHTRAAATPAPLPPSWRRHRRDLSLCSQTPISGLMSRSVVCAAPDMSIEGLTALLLERGLSAVPVVTQDGRLVGVAAKTDLLREAQDRGDDQERIPLRMSRGGGVRMALGRGFHATCLARATVEEIMTPLAVTVSEAVSVAQAAALMTSKHIDHLPVVGPAGKVIGILTALDVVAWLAQLGA